MSTTHEEIQIDLDAADDPAKKVAKGQEPAAAVVEVPAADPTKDTTGADEGLEKLKKQLETEKAGRIAAERRADQASESEARARGEVHGTQIDLLTNAIASVKSVNDGLKKEYSAALTASDFDRVADIQLEMSTNAAKLLALENGKTQLEKQPKPTPRQQQDAVEEFASRCSAPAAAWVRAHPEYVRDPHKNRLMLAAHELALAQDIKADTDEYFESVEKTLNLRQPVTNGNGHDPDPAGDPDPMSDAASKPAPRKAAPAAAPVSRSGNGTGARPNTVTLTPQEVEIATMNGMTPEEYAKNKIALKKEGRLN
jgi:hypothetical protein